jgi:hypothetical protein
MSRSLLAGLALAALTIGAPTAHAQTPPPANSYTFVAQWQIPRANWATFVGDFEKNTKPILEKLGADGTLTSWGAFEHIVHSPNGATHGVWWSGTSYAAMEKARIALVQASAASTSLASATAHYDFYFHSIAGNGKPASGAGYLNVSSYLLKPGKGQEWKQLWDKYNKPAYDELVAKGLLLGYAIDAEDVHTDNPGWRSVVTVVASAEADDQVTAAFDALDAKRTPEERKTMELMMDGLMDRTAHRDIYARIIAHWAK